MEHWLPMRDPSGRLIAGYEVSDRGRCRSYWTKGFRSGIGTAPTVRPPVLDGRGRSMVMLIRVGRGKYRTMSVSSLVAATFLGRRPKGQVVTHLDHDFRNHRADNLAWVTRSEAAKHAIEKKPRRPLAKLTPAKVRAIRRWEGLAKDAAKKYGVRPRAIYNIWWGRAWVDAT